jgi:hypothetical protein
VANRSARPPLKRIKSCSLASARKWEQTERKISIPSSEKLRLAFVCLFDFQVPMIHHGTLDSFLCMWDVCAALAPHAPIFFQTRRGFELEILLANDILHQTLAIHNDPPGIIRRLGRNIERARAPISPYYALPLLLESVAKSTCKILFIEFASGIPLALPISKCIHDSRS